MKMQSLFHSLISDLLLDIFLKGGYLPNSNWTNICNTQSNECYQKAYKKAKANINFFVFFCVCWWNTLNNNDIQIEC